MNEIKIPEYSGSEPIEITVSQSPQLSQSVNKFAPNSCFANSYESASETRDLMVEGILVIMNTRELIDVIRHCWNKRRSDGSYYDVTKDYVWNNDIFKQRASNIGCGDISYRYLACIEYDKSEVNTNGREIAFKYSYISKILHLKEINPINKLYDLFTNLLEKQRTQHQYDWNISVEDINNLINTEHLFLSESLYSQMFQCLGLDLCLLPTRKKVFLNLPFAEEFTKEKDYEGTCLINCGDNVDKATLITSTIIRKVYTCTQNISLSSVNDGLIDPKEYIKNNHHISFLFVELPFNEKIYTKIGKKIDYFNRKAEKHCYTGSQIIFDEKTRTISGSYQAVDEKSGKNYFAEVLIAGRNADLSAEITDIIKLSYKLFEN